MLLDRLFKPSKSVRWEKTHFEHLVTLNSHTWRRLHGFYSSFSASRQTRLRFSRTHRSLRAIKLGASGPQLLTWLQDPNWSISGRVKNVLLLNPSALVEPIRLVLAGDDEPWQSNCLDLVLRLPRDIQSLLWADLEAFNARISDGSDLNWDFRSDVKEVLSRMAT